MTKRMDYKPEFKLWLSLWRAQKGRVLMSFTMTFKVQSGAEGLASNKNAKQQRRISKKNGSLVCAIVDIIYQPQLRYSTYNQK